jgi:hypothetical protein
MTGDGYNFRQLRDAIVARSNSKSWETAKLEWRLHQISEADEPETCLCTHFPIIEICMLRNIKNGNVAEVGNVCVKKFMGIRSDKIFSGIRRIRKDMDKSPNAEMIELLYEQGLLSSWERSFSHDTVRKRNLTSNQLLKRHEINRKILENIVRARI